MPAEICAAIVELFTTVYVVPLIVAVCPTATPGHLQVPESKTIWPGGGGHVPQLGVLLLLKGAFVLKLVGWEEIFPTHQEEIFWLKALAPLNISFMEVTFEVFQLPSG